MHSSKIHIARYFYDQLQHRSGKISGESIYGFWVSIRPAFFFNNNLPGD